MPWWEHGKEPGLQYRLLRPASVAAANCQHPNRAMFAIAQIRFARHRLTNRSGIIRVILAALAMGCHIARLIFSMTATLTPASNAAIAARPHAPAPITKTSTSLCINPSCHPLY
jgi:hypothetical protein